MSSTYDKCQRCGEYGWTGSHKCPPEWLFSRYPSEPDSWQSVYARQPDQAAEKAAAKTWESGDRYTIEIWLRKPGEQTAYRWDVDVEMVPSFTAGREREEITVTDADDIEPAEESEDADDLTMRPRVEEDAR